MKIRSYTQKSLVLWVYQQPTQKKIVLLNHNLMSLLKSFAYLARIYIYENGQICEIHRKDL
jgi:hypothetical protein